MKKAKSTEKSRVEHILKPCPFCGRDEPEIREQEGLSAVYYFMECQRCICRGPRSMVKENASKLWNKRYVIG